MEKPHDASRRDMPMWTVICHEILGCETIPEHLPGFDQRPCMGSDGFPAVIMRTGTWLTREDHLLVLGPWQG